MHVTRDEINKLADLSDLENLEIKYRSIEDNACALLAYQRPKQIANKSRESWENGDRVPLFEEVRTRKDGIIRGAFLEIYQEYVPLKEKLKPRSIKTVCDIGCGQGINDVFLHDDFAPGFTLVDIEETDKLYHFWAEEGAGYASLGSAKALLMENGVAKKKIATINPRKSDWTQTGNGFDLVISLYSCGFHYPIDEYLDLFLETLETGGAVCLDLRKEYYRENGNSLTRLREAGNAVVVYKDRKSFRVLFQK